MLPDTQVDSPSLLGMEVIIARALVATQRTGFWAADVGAPVLGMCFPQGCLQSCVHAFRAQGRPHRWLPALQSQGPSCSGSRRQCWPQFRGLSCQCWQSLLQVWLTLLQMWGPGWPACCAHSFASSWSPAESHAISNTADSQPHIGHSAAHMHEWYGQLRITRPQKPMYLTRYQSY